MSLTRRLPAAAGIITAAIVSAPLHAQVTTATLAGRITNPAGEGVSTAQVTAVHQPSGTTYRATPRGDGRFTIPGMRVGGPYQVTVRALGFAPVVRSNITLSLGQQSELDLRLTSAAVQLSAVQVTAENEADVINSARTGAATRVATEAIQTLPTISRTIGDFTRLTPQSNGSGGFAGQDNRLNNIQIDGAFFNNAFGLGSGQPGGRTGTAPIPLDAIDQIQVNIAPYDVRQGNFVGAGVNAVTRSGTNDFEGSLYYITRNEDLVGTRAGANRVNPGTFTFGQLGGRIGGPIIRNKLFFFANVEDDNLNEPGALFTPRASTGVTPEGNVTRVLESDVTRVQQLLADRFGYQTGPFTGYQLETPSRRYLAKLDWNASERNRLSLRYTQLEAQSDVPVSNSSSLGVTGNRRGNLQSLSFQNSGYLQREDIKSLVGEWNAQLSRGSNQMIVGYTANDESRGSRGEFFPFVDILEAGQNYLSFGFEPFTPNNELRYNTFQVQNNLQLFFRKHEVTLGGFFERYESENVFFPGSQSVYTYNSLADFFTDVNDFAANPTRTTSPVTLRRFQVRYNNIPGQEKPIQPLEVNSYGLYAQDQYRPNERVTITAGIRADLPVFGSTALTNAAANALQFRDENGNTVRYQTQALPKSNVLVSPRLGFNWDVRGDRSTQLRGGTGIFSGRPLFVWISNQVGNNGILTGFVEQNNTRNFPFNPDPNAYKPTNVTGAPAAAYELNFTDRNFRFPQQWRSNVAVDQRLPLGLVGTAEFIYGRDVNGIYYIDANLPAPASAFTGPDTRPRYTSNRINSNIARAVVLKNQNEGYNYNLAFSLERAFSSGFFAKAAYAYGDAFNTTDPGSIASGSFTGNQVPGDPNRAPVSRSGFAPGHRSFLALSYRREYFRFGATSISLFTERSTIGHVSYTVGGDLNGDGAAANDLLYVPRDRSEMNFLPITRTTGTGASQVTETLFTPAQQADAFEAYINQDPYLRTRRGQYAERNGFRLPQLLRADLSVAQDIFRNAFGKRNNFQVRLDVFNVGNLLNDDWGVGRRIVNTQPVVPAGVDASGRPNFRYRTVNNQLLSSTFQATSGLGDVYRMQLGVRYTFQ